MLKFISIFIVLLISLSVAINAANSPVVLVPGVGASQLEVKLTNAKAGAVCPKSTTDFFHVWANPLYLNGLLASCMNDYLSQTWTQGKSSNAQGVEVRVKQFDKVSSVEQLRDGLGLTDYLKQVSDTLASKANLKKDVTLRGAPYDWRKTLNELSNYFQQMQRQVEDAYTKGGNTPVVMIGHSMGCLVTTKFLQTRPQAWKDKYIASFVSVNGPYGGAVQSLVALIHGFNLDISFLPANQIRAMQRTFLSTYLMLPSRLAFNPSFLLFIGPQNKQYNLIDLENGNIYKAINYPEAINLQKLVLHDINLNQPLGVKLHCVLGDGVKTVNALKIDDKHFPDKVSELFYGGGDGTVNAESLKLCVQLKGAKQIQTHYFPGGKHTDMLKDAKVVNLLVDIVSNRVPNKSVIYY